MIESLIDARKSRRKIIELLTKQQLDDSCCAEKLKQVGLNGKRKILELLAAWLTSLQPGARLSDTDQEALASIKASLNVDNWLSLQHRETELDQKKKEAGVLEEELYKVYDRVAPNGFISILLLSGAEKAKAERLQAEYRSFKSSRELVERDLASVRKEIQETIGRFLGDAASPESLGVLARESSIKRQLSGLLKEAAEDAISVWRPHAEMQLTLLCELEKEGEKLS
jgi:hypothetical protein